MSGVDPSPGGGAASPEPPHPSDGDLALRPDPGPGPEPGATAAGADTVPAPSEADPDRPAAPAKRRRRWRIPPQIRIPVFILVLVFVFEYFLLPEIAKARNDLHQVGSLNPVWFVLACLLEVAALLAYAQLTYTVLSPGAPRRFRLFRVNMWSLAVSHVLPGGTAPGTAAGYRLLNELGVPGSTAGFGMALQGIGSAVVLNLLFWVALIISIPINGVNPAYGTAAIAGTLLLAAFFGTVFMLTRGQHKAADRLYRIATHLPLVNPDRVAALTQHVADRLRVLLQDRRLLGRALLWASANWLLDAASLWVFLFAFGSAVSPIDLLVSYGLANILAAIPLTPGGLGVVETVTITTLVGFGVPGRVAGLGVLAWRLVNFWLPIPAGGLAYLSLRLGPLRHGRLPVKGRPAEG